MKYIQICLGLFTFIIVVACAFSQPMNNTTVGECTVNNDCSSEKICLDLQCVDPCKGGCGLNTVCVVKDLLPICSCKSGFEGDPFTECKNGAEVECSQNAQCSVVKACLNNTCLDPCPGACGPNTDCRVVNHRPFCACSKGFILSPNAGCIPKCSVQNNHKQKDKTFFISDHQDTWYNALRKCHDNGTVLATINNGKEYATLVEAYTAKNDLGISLWLGGHNFGVYYNPLGGYPRSSTFIWITSGAAVPPEYWSSGEPSDYEHHCLLMSSSPIAFRSFNCNEKRNFACEKV